MNPFFDQLGRKVLERWKQQNYSLEVFPKLAEIAINESLPSEQVNLEEMISEFLTNDEQPFQSQSGFGQPELVAFHHPRFYIQILFWLEGTTDIHQHEFSGAFHVMSGSSIHAEYEFESTQSITPYLRTGDLRMKQIELLETGRTVPITSGRECIHSLFHMDTPSVTVVVRTHNDPGTGPQFNYLPPHIAIDPIHAGSEALTIRRNQLLDVLESAGHPDYAMQVGEMIANLDFESGFHTLQHSMRPLQVLDEWESILEAFQNKHADLASGVAATLAESRRREVITQMRFYVEDPDHRFFLALLMNVSKQADIFALISGRFPDQSPSVTILNWAEELLEPTDFGLALLDATFPEDLDVPLQTQGEMLISALRHGLEGTELSELAEIHTVLRESCLGVLFT